MKPAFGSPAEIDARLASAESAGLVKLRSISANLGVEVEGIDLTTYDKYAAELYGVLCSLCEGDH